MDEPRTTPRSAARDELEGFAEKYFERFLRLYPESNAAFGLAKYRHLDGLWTDFSQNGGEDQQNFFSDAQRSLDRIAAHAGELTPAEAMDLELLKTQVRAQLHSLTVAEDFHRDIGLFLAGGAGPFAVLHHQVLNASSAPEEWEAILSRLRGLPKLLAEAERNARRGVKTGSRFDIAHAQRDGISFWNSLSEYLRGDFLKEVQARMLPDTFRTMEAPLRSAVQEAGLSMQAFQAFVQKEILPIAVKDGLAVGEEEYGWRLRNNLCLEYSAAELIEMGRDLVAELRERLTAMAARLTPAQPFPDVFRALMERNHPKSDHELMEFYRQVNDRASDFIAEKKLFRLPPSYSMRWTGTPPSMARHVSVASYFTPPLYKPGAAGHFFVGLTGDDPARLQGYCLDSIPFIVIHEACPGHNLQFSCFIERRKDIPKIRFLDPGNTFLASLNLEGYAHYAEGLMLQHGFYSPEEELFAVRGELWRAARVVVDASIHSGRMTSEQGVRYLIKEGALDERLAADEVYRYCRFPTQALAYTIGRRQVERIKQELHDVLKDRFEESRFHDSYFLYGFAPPNLLRPMMLQQARQSLKEPARR